MKTRASLADPLGGGVLRCPARAMDADELLLLVTREMPYRRKGELRRLLALMLEIDHNGLKHLLEPLRAARKPD